MAISRKRYYRGLYAVAAMYDLVIGVVFLFFGRWAFDILDIEEKYPEGGFVQLLGAFVMVLGVGYYLIWRSDLWRNRDLVALGALYKLALQVWGSGLQCSTSCRTSSSCWGSAWRTVCSWC